MATLSSALSSFTDTLGLVKKTWTNMGLPTSFAPTMDIEEIDKRIADLQAVEQWLIANQTMLRGTIQGLEVQRNTIATVQALGQSVGTPTIAKALSQAQGLSPEAFSAQTLEALSRQFSGFATTPKVAPAATQAEAPATITPTKSKSSKKSPANQAPSKGTAGTQALGNDGANVWWDMLQGQFNQIAQTAMANSANLGMPSTKEVGKVVTRAMGKAAAQVAGQVARDTATDIAKSVAQRVVKRVTGSTASAATKARSRVKPKTNSRTAPKTKR